MTALKSDFSKKFAGNRISLIQGGMANIATGEFAAAVSNAGALGLIKALGGMNADTLRENIRRCKALTVSPSA